MPRDLVISIYSQRAQQLTEEEVYTGAMQAVKLAKEIESLMTKTKGRQPRRRRPRIAAFRERRRARREAKRKQKQTCNAKYDRRKQKVPMNATSEEKFQARAGIRGRISRIFRRGQENQSIGGSEAKKLQVKEGIKCRAETLLTE